MSYLVVNRSPFGFYSEFLILSVLVFSVSVLLLLYFLTIEQ